MGRSILVTLRLAGADRAASDLGKVDAAGRKAAAGMNAAGTSAAQGSEALNSISNRLGVAGAGLLAFAGASVAAFANFDEAMSFVKATGKDAAGSIDLLREAALKAGQDTQFSATQAAGGVEELAKAGVSAADILQGGLSGALNLAASGGLEVGEASEIAATALTQFGLKGRDVGHVADLLAAGASEAQGGVGDLGAALKQTGLVANSTGLTIEETTAGLSAFASAGLIGSDAGTSFKSMLQRLTPQSKEAERAMDDLGISAYDANGQFVGLAAFAGNLQNALRDLTPEQRNAALATIFGSDAVRAANVIYEEGELGIKRWTDAVDQQGFAAETAAVRMDNLKGDLEQLGGAFETALINMGEKANSPLRGVVQSITGVVNAFSEAPDAVQGATLAIAGGGGFALLSVAALGKVVTAIADVKQALQTLNVSFRTASLATAGIGGVLGIALTALSAWAQGAQESRARTEGLADSFDEVTGAVTKSSRALVAQALQSGSGWGPFRNELDTAANNAEKLGLSLDVVTDAILGNQDAMAQVTEATSRAQAAYDGLSKSSDGYVQGDVDGHIRSEQQSAEALTNAISNLNGEFTNAQELDRQRREAIEGTTEATDEAAAATAANASAVDVYSDAVLTGTDTAMQYADALGEVISKQQEAAGVVLTAREAENQFQEAIMNATQSVIDNGVTLDGNTEAGIANRRALDDIAESGWEVVRSSQANGDAQDVVQGKMQAARDAFLNAAGAAGMNADEANRLADELGLIPANVNVNVSADVQQARTDADRIVREINNLQAQIKIRAVTDSSWQPYKSDILLPRASGGEIPHIPGSSAGRDSVPIIGMPGEHMLTTRDVAAMGGQSGVYAFRRALHSGSGIPRFANGGAVAARRRYADGGAVMARPSGALSGYRSTMGSVTNNRNLNVNVNATGDPNAIGRATVRRLKDAAAVSPAVRQMAAGALG